MKQPLASKPAASAAPMSALKLPAADLSPAELIGLLRADQRRRWRAGERVPVESYLQEYPALRDQEDATLDLIANEALLREETGLAVNVQDLCERFPQYQSQIRRQVDLHRLLAEPGPTVDTHVTLPPSGKDSSGFEAPPVVNGYEIYRELGKGGMGVVYKAKQLSLGRTVALKMMRAGHASPEEMLRFRIEAEAVARFQHSNIVQIYEVGESEGRPYFSLEYMDGGSLEDKLDGKPMPPKQAAELLGLLARAMHAAHLRGIVHRDLKPANILLSSDGTAKIADFGLAKRLDAATQTQTGIIMGTPSYMAPEQAAGRSDRIGPATDIYALGAILYDLLTGRPPFEAENSLETIMQVIHREPLPPRTLQPKVSRDLETICLKCLEKRPEKRYASAQDLADDLSRYLHHEPIRARPIGRLERAYRWCRRQPGWAAVIGVSILALLGFLAAGAWFTKQLHAELMQTTAARQDAERAHQEVQLTLVRETAGGINGDLRQLAAVPRTVAAALQQRSDWSEAQLDGWLRTALANEPRIFGMCVAFEPGQFQAERKDYAFYLFRGQNGLEGKQLLPPEYQPLYREWPWYRRATDRKEGVWSEPYVDEGGGDIPMVTYSVPFYRQDKFAGVVTADLSLDYFKKLRESVHLSRCTESAHGFVVTQRGIVLSHPDPQFRYPGPRSDLTQRSDAQWARFWPRILAGESGAAPGTCFLSGQPATFLFAPVPATGWSFVEVVPEK